MAKMHFVPMSSTLTRIGTATCLATLVGCSAWAQSVAETPENLRPPSSFSSISDRAARSRALFAEAAKVITSPRCMNCHPAGDHPTQGNDEHVHQPAATRGEAGVGIPGLVCAACHTDKNFPLVGATSYQSIPGHPRWGLAPIEMAWQGKRLRRSAVRSKIPLATVDAVWLCSTSTWRRTTWWAGHGIRVPAAARRRGPNENLVRSSRRG